MKVGLGATDAWNPADHSPTIPSPARGGGPAGDCLFID
jgi:hypothetical protein